MDAENAAVENMGFIYTLAQNIDWAFWIAILLLFALVWFSVWCFILNFRGGWVCTTKDLITTFISGGVLGVVVMVFGITGDIKSDTQSIYSAVRELKPSGNGTKTFESQQALVPIFMEQQHEDLVRAVARVEKQNEQILSKLNQMQDAEQEILPAPQSAEGTAPPVATLDLETLRQANSILESWGKILRVTQTEAGLVQGDVRLQFVCRVLESTGQLICYPRPQ